MDRLVMVQGKRSGLPRERGLQDGWRSSAPHPRVVRGGILHAQHKPIVGEHEIAVKDAGGFRAQGIGLVPGEEMR